MWLLVVLLALMIPLIAVLLDSQLGRALASRLERGAPGQDVASGQRMLALEAEVERLSKDLQRLEEQTEFLHHLLEEKRSGGALPSGEQST
jgi:hypothetical protein